MRCIVIRGGEHFMARGDVKAFRDGFVGGAAADIRMKFEALLRDARALILSSMPKPVLASVSCSADGFGMSLMMAGDLVLAADSASFTLASAAEPDFFEGLGAFIDKRQPNFKGG